MKQTRTETGSVAHAGLLRHEISRKRKTRSRQEQDIEPTSLAEIGSHDDAKRSQEMSLTETHSVGMRLVCMSEKGKRDTLDNRSTAQTKSNSEKTPNAPAPFSVSLIRYSETEKENNYSERKKDALRQSRRALGISASLLESASIETH